MKITVKQAYEIAKSELGNDFKILACTELLDSWIFAFQWANGTAIFCPPIQVKNNGICAFWDKKFQSAIEGAEWLEKNGKNIPIEELEKYKTNRP